MFRCAKDPEARLFSLPGLVIGVELEAAHGDFQRGPSVLLLIRIEGNERHIGVLIPVVETELQEYGLFTLGFHLEGLGPPPVLAAPIGAVPHPDVRPTQPGR